jgi:DNA-directed RNA polymerase subunit RPC12/RpoP
MRHFFSKNTVEASIWCTKCGKPTHHVIADGRPLHCKVCQVRPLEKTPQDAPVEKSGDLFE